MFSLPWGHAWYWYVFFATNVPLALGQAGTAGLMPLWSLAVEEQFYLLWPWIVLLCSRKNLRTAAVATVVLSPLIRAAATPLFSSHLPIYCLTIFRADTLAAGALLAIAQAEDRNWIVRRRRVGLYALLIAGTLLALLSARPDFRTSANSILFNSVGYSLSAMIFAGALTYVLALEHGIVYQVLTCKAARYLGRISYTFYLYHVAVLEKTAAYVSSPLARAFICFVLTFTVAAVSWYWLESRILNFSLESWKTRVLPALGEHGRATELRSELS